MGDRRRGENGDPGTGFPPEAEEPGSLLQRAVSLLHSSSLDSSSQLSLHFSKAILVENQLFLSELKAFARAKEAAGYSQEELQETFAFLLFDKEEEAKEVCQSGLRVNSSSISTLGDPAKGVYISKYSDCLQPRPWPHGKSGYIVICKLIKGKVRAIAENSTSSYTCPSPGYDCHVSNHSPSRSSQYYVYEVSGGSTAERPRQVCPYIFLACHYREPKEMPVLATHSLAEQNHRALYCPWKGQLSIQGQLLCTIALRNPYSSTIPAQLPPNLDINHVMGLADLKKKLPEAAFGEKNYTGNEVCFQGVYSSLYEVEISSKDQSKMDQLVENLKEKDLAIIKYLQDQGVLILLTSSALAREEGLEPKDPVSLLALFLFPSPRALSPPAEKQDPKAGKGSNSRNSISLKITSVLPGLRYALQKAADSSCSTTGSSSWLKEHLQEYSKLQENSAEKKIPVLSVPSPGQDEGADDSQKISERRLAQLRRYLTDPSSYTLGVAAALGWLSDAGRNLGSSSSSSSSSELPDLSSPPRGTAEKSEDFVDSFSKSVTSPTKPWGRESRRKSSRILGKNLSPLKAQTNPEEEDSKGGARKKINLASSCPKKSGNSNEPMLKLANLRLPHGRKRGAEVLAAEIVHKSQSEEAEEENSAPNGPGVEAKRPKTLENPETKKIPGAESATKAGKNKMQKNVENRTSKPPENHQEQSGCKELLPSEASSQSQGAAIPRNETDPIAIPETPKIEIDPTGLPATPKNEIYPTGIPGTPKNEIYPMAIPAIQRNEICPIGIPGIQRNEIYPVGISGTPKNEIYPMAIPGAPRNEIYPIGIPTLGFTLQGPNSESHALNLLADLALGSCIPPLIPKDSGIILLESRDSNPKSLSGASDHKYHRADKQESQKNPTSSSKASLNQPIPDKTDPKLSPPKEKTSGILSGSSVNPSPAIFQLFPPQEAPEVNRHSIISDEHSYASPMPDDPKNLPDPKGNPNPGSAPSRNVPAAPLVGKVLPFRHHSGASEPARSRSSPRKKEEFSKRHTVSVCGNSLKVTCRWEGEYLFHLDSRYTNNSLEKTVIRALHGPWDPNLPDDVEGMKLILHMWVALFYKKPSKLLSSSRKVVEHINPKKFVSINSSGGFLELSDDSQDCFSFETCPADSGSDPDQTPSSSLDPSTPSQADKEEPQTFPADSQTDADGAPGAGDSTVSSSSGELPCGEEEEPSSTSCPESLSLQDHPREKPQVAHGEPQGDPRESGPAEEPAKEELLEARITPSPSQEPSSPSKAPDAPGTENPGSQTPISSTSPRTEPLCAAQENGEQQEKQQEKQQEAGSESGPGPPEDEEGTGGSGHALEVEAGADAQPGCHSTPLEANPGSAEPGGATEEGEGSQEPSEHSEKEEREVEEEEEKEEENEEFEDEGSFHGPVDLVLSESSDAEMECEQDPGNSASPEEFGAPEEEPVPSPASLASPCPHRSSPVLSDGAEPGAFPEEMSPKREELPDPWDAPATPDWEPAGAGAAEVGSPHSAREELLLPPEPSPARGAQPDSGSQQEEQDQAPSGERWEPAGSTESPRGQGVSLALSPDSSSVCLTSPDGSLDPWAAPEDQPMESIQSPSQSDVQSLSQLGGDEADPDLNSLDNEESNQGGNGVLVEEEQGSPCANGMEELDDPMGAGDGRDSPLDYPDTGEECRAEEREDVFPEGQNSPGDDTSNMEMAEPEILLQQADREFLESEPSSSSREGISAIRELPRQQQQQQSFPNIHGDSAPASPGDSSPSIPAVPSRRESVLCCLWKPCREGGATQLSLDCSLNPSLSQGLIPSPAPCSPVEEPPELGSAPPSPCDAWDDPEGAEPLPGALPPSPDSARWSRSCDSPRNAGGSPGEELRAGSTPSPAASPGWECEPWDACEGSQPFPDPDCAQLGEGEIPDSPVPASPWDEHRDPSGEQLEFSDAEDIPEQLPSQDIHEEGLAFEDPLENSFGDSEQEYLEGNSRSPLPSRNSCIVRSTDAAGARTNRASSSGSSVPTEEQGEGWDWEVPRDPGSSVLQERMENLQLPTRRSHSARESHLARSLMGTWRSFEEITQSTLDMECLRFHFKLKEILRNGRASFSTSGSIFPTDSPPRAAPVAPSPRCRSPLRVTIPPWDTRPRSHRDTRAGRGGSRDDPGAPVHLGKLRFPREPPEPRGAVAGILEEYSQFRRAVLGRARPGSGAAAPGWAGSGRGGPAAFRELLAELRGALRSRLRRVAAAARPGMFYLLESGKEEPFFDSVKALLKARGLVKVEPLSFCRAGRGQRLLVIVRNQDIATHIHTVPCLLQLKLCPSVVFAGVDEPEEVTGDTFQELFQAGGFVVSDEELLDRITLGQLQEVVKVLERLNRSGRWKWLLHHREGKQLRADLGADPEAQRKQRLLRWGLGEELLELLPFHGCDSSSAPRRLPCLLELQVQHIRARLAVFLTANPSSSSSREILESKGILVADIDTFLGTVQDVAAPFRKSYW